MTGEELKAFKYPQRIGARCVVSTTEDRINRRHGGWMESPVRKNLEQQVAGLLAGVMVRRVDDDVVEYSLDLYVATPEQLARMVEKRADDMNRGRPPDMGLLFS